MSEQVKSATCEFCNPRCRILVRSRDGELVGTEVDRSHPWARSTWPPTEACPRYQGIGEFVRHPDRLSFPLKRAGARGEGKWRRISWTQALDEIAARLAELRERYGAETLACHSGTRRTTEWVQSRFMNLFGSPNHIGPPSVCHAPCINTATAMLGWPPLHRTFLRFEPESGRLLTRCVLLIGLNPALSRPHIWKSVRDAKEQGCKLIVVDPRRTETAALADLWLPVRPGTDTALLLAMANVIIEEELYDKDFVRDWCHGFPELRERAREYPPETAAAITLIPAENIRAAARMYAGNTPTITTNGMGLEQQSNGVAGVQAKFILSLLTGSIDVPGGEYLPGPVRCVSEPEMELRDQLTQEQKDKQIDSRRFRLVGWPGLDAIMPHVVKVWKKPVMTQRASAVAHHPSVCRAMLSGHPYPVRALIGIASNPLLTQPNARLIHAAIKSLDLYVVQEYWLTPSAQLADYVLPVASWLERPYLGAGIGSMNTILGGEQALPARIEGKHDRKTDYEILRGLGMRLGQASYWPWEDLEQVFDYMLAPLGLTFREFMTKGGYDSPPRQYYKYRQTGFATPTGKAELASTIFQKLGYDPLPRHEEPHENAVSNPELARTFPLTLSTGGRIGEYFASEQRQIPSIRRRHPDPLVQLHPATAAAHGIAEGDWVRIESPRGRIRMKAALFDGLPPDMVHCEHGWWFPELPGEEPCLHGVWESNANVLTADDPDLCDPRSGGWPLKWGLCRIYKATGTE
jgi:anaerobic selenocysteine-containing dehydrogenase